DREIYYHEAMVNLVFGRVIWIKARGWVSLPGMPENATARIGLIEAQEPVFVSPCHAEMCRVSYPLVIIHDTTDDVVCLVTAFEAALWPVDAVKAFGGLETFLLAHIDLNCPQCTYVDYQPGQPSADSWLVQARLEAG